MEATELLVYLDIVFKSALTKTRDDQAAEDLTQETYLCALQALSKGVAINNPKAYLMSILQKRFFLHLREKYKLSIVSYDNMPFEVPTETDFGELERTEDAEIIRRELAFLSRTYREVMIRYYMKNEPVNDIAKTLSIPKGTVLSRLVAGRKKVKEGINKMEKYIENSYLPEILSMGMNGRMGINGEPLSCVQNALDQNVLLVAYEQPMTPLEIAEALGTPMAFIEEIVDRLVDAQLLKREGTKVYTDFVIASLKDGQEALEVAKDFACTHFDTIHSITKKMVSQYNEIPGFLVFNDTQKYMYAAFSLRHNYTTPVVEAACQGNDFVYEPDYPDRPNFGKWIAIGSRFPHGFNFDESKHTISGRLSIDDISENISGLREWCTKIGRTHMAKFTHSVTAKERARLLDAVRTNNLSSFQLELLPDFTKLNFIKEEKGKKVPAVPFISKSDEETFYTIEGEGGQAFCSQLLDEAVRVCKGNTLSYPKRINVIPTHLIVSNAIADLPMCYIFEAAKRGLITIKEGKNYPIMILVTN